MQRGQFSSTLTFVLAAAGSAIGLGNIWGFPTNAAENGGAAFLLMYLILAFLLAYPALMAELIIGRHTRANMVMALDAVSTGNSAKKLGRLTGYTGLITASLILSFYGIVAGWMLGSMAQPVTTILGLDSLGQWLTEFGTARNITLTAIFMLLTALIINAGVEQGIEKVVAAVNAFTAYSNACTNCLCADSRGCYGGSTTLPSPRFFPDD